MCFQWENTTVFFKFTVLEGILIFACLIFAISILQVAIIPRSQWLETWKSSMIYNSYTSCSLLLCSSYTWTNSHFLTPRKKANTVLSLTSPKLPNVYSLVACQLLIFTNNKYLNWTYRNEIHLLALKVRLCSTRCTIFPPCHQLMRFICFCSLTHRWVKQDFFF